MNSVVTDILLKSTFGVGCMSLSNLSQLAKSQIGGRWQLKQADPVSFLDATESGAEHAWKNVPDTAYSNHH